jgi:hypothetical protein
LSHLHGVSAHILAPHYSFNGCDQWIADNRPKRAGLEGPASCDVSSLLYV